MNDPVERSESGAEIFRHKPREKPFTFALGDEESMAAIERHIERHVGKPANVFHELLSDLVHIDVHVVRPTTDRNYFTLITSGMSDQPMAAPEGLEEYRHAELMICLPPTWRLEQESFKDERHYWPVRWLKMLARMPHEYDTWLFTGHTIPNGDPPGPFADNTGLCCALLLEPVLFGEGFRVLDAAADRKIHFLALVPLYREEMDLKLKRGLEALVAKFNSARVTELLDINRGNVCKRRFGIF